MNHPHPSTAIRLAAAHGRSALRRRTDARPASPQISTPSSNCFNIGKSMPLLLAGIALFDADSPFRGGSLFCHGALVTEGIRIAGACIRT
ncbi:hypothetical protein ACL02O_33355 [Micromonospora sp. MS34]|uniref:hypothetical protein n=1 Tax=Micromonospora sp. MS34 TaxID=3385971 RepID=UPI0039A1A9E9